MTNNSNIKYDPEKLPLSILEKAKQYLQRQEHFGSIYDVANLGNHLSSWATGTLGYVKLKCLYENKSLYKQLFSVYVRNIICLGYQKKFGFEQGCKFFNKKHVIVSWCYKDDFLKDGSFQCRYFNYNSRKLSDVLWVLMSLDDFVPDTKDTNIIIFSKEQAKQFSVATFVNNLLFCLKNHIPCAIGSIVSKKFADAFIEQICIQSLEKLLLPYEAQPWQHVLCLTVKKQNKNVEIIGDLHSCLPPFPSDYIKRYGAPNKVLVHGQGQKNIMVNMLGWNKEEIEVIPSRRFTKNIDKHLVNKILLPYSFGQSEFILKMLQILFKCYGNMLPRLEIRNHPVQANSSKHNDLIQDIIKLQSKCYTYSDYPSGDDKVSVVVGASSVIIECLAHGIKVFQIVEHPVFDLYSDLIWTDLKVQHVHQNIVVYSFQEVASYVEFGDSQLQRVFAND